MPDVAPDFTQPFIIYEIREMQYIRFKWTFKKKNYDEVNEPVLN